jgi:hypothetical protein
MFRKFPVLVLIDREGLLGQVEIALSGNLIKFVSGSSEVVDPSSQCETFLLGRKTKLFRGCLHDEAPVVDPDGTWRRCQHHSTRASPEAMVILLGSIGTLPPEVD